MLPDNIQPEIVIEHHGEPMTTSLAIAEGVQMDHASVIKLVRKYVGELYSFGEIGFEIRFNPQGRPTEFAWLNEPQATLLITFMRNSEVVVAFKVALVRAFFEMRDRLRAAHAASGPFLTGNPAHVADQLVSADRIFRSILRSSRSAGLSLPRALRRANEVAQQRTGINLLTELDAADMAADEAAVLDPHGAHAFCDVWLAGQLPLPVVPCRSEDLFSAYEHWRQKAGCVPGTLPRVVAVIVRRPDLRHRRARHADASGAAVMSGFVIPDCELMPPPGVTQFEWLTLRTRLFVEALNEWRTANS